MLERCTLIFLIVFPSIAHGQLNMADPPDSLKEQRPGQSTSLVFHLENIAKKKTSYELEVLTSDPLIVPILPEGGLHLPDDPRSSLILPIKISLGTPPGLHVVTLSCKDRTTGERSIHSKTVRVAKIRALKLTALESPRYVSAGDTISASFLLNNLGNVEQAIRISSNVATIEQHRDLVLFPNETRIVRVRKETNGALGRRDIQNIDLTPGSIDSTFRSISAHASVEIIPTEPVSEDIYLRYPVHASISYIAMRNRGTYQKGFQGELYGRGTLGPSNSAELEFRALTKNPVDFNTFTPYEEYFATLRTKRIYAHIGDKVYSSSFLTEYARYGRGAELTIDLGKMEFGAFYNRPRFFRDIRDETGMYSRLELDSNSTLGAGVLIKRPDNPQDSPSPNQVLTQTAVLPFLTGKTALFGHIDLEAELALSKMDTTRGSAFRIRADGNHKRLSANLSYLYASPSFAGYFSNSSMFNGNLMFRIGSRTELLANYNQDAQNFRRDTIFLAAPYRNNLRYGVNFRYSQNGNITFYHGYQHYRDRQLPRQFDYREQFFRTSVYQRLWDIDLDLEGQLGKTDNHITGTNGSSSHIRASIGFEKLRTSFNIFGSVAKNSRYLEQSRTQLYYGARIISRFSPSSSLHIFYQNDFLPEEYYMDRNIFELVFRQQILASHSIDLSGRYMLQRGQLGHGDFFASIRYTAQLKLPLKRIASYTTLSGNISNIGSGKIAGLRLKLGNMYAITDSRGNYTFKNVVPGEHFLEIDRASIGFEDIPDVPVPISLVLREDEKNTLDFKLARAAKITGKLDIGGRKLDALDKSKRNVLPQKRAGRASMVIEASSPDLVLRKMCEIGETFDFTYLRPGEWRVKIYGSGPQSRYSLPTEEYRLTLASGEAQHIVVPVEIKEKKIQFQQQSIPVNYHGKNIDK